MTHQILQVVIGLAVMVVSALTGWPLVIAILSRSRASGSREEDTKGTGAELPGTPGGADHAVGASTKASTPGADTGSDTDTCTGADTGTGRGRPGSVDGADNSEEAHGLRGGLWIGLLERFAATGAVLLGEYTILAAIVAVKGLGRFRELSTPAASERFVVGTLASLTWSVLLGVIGRGLLALLV